MIRLRIGILLLAATFWAQRCGAQSTGFAPGQINTTMCQWQTPRVGVVRDAVYIDGGYLWWRPGQSDGSYGVATEDDNPLGLVYVLNFSLPFGATADFNQTALFSTFSKGAGGSGSNNVGPNYLDGTMFANDYEWWTYGGLLLDPPTGSPPPATAAALYAVYPTAPGEFLAPGFDLVTLNNSVTRYVTYGAGVSVPSENLGFYFGGTRSQTAGDIFYPSVSEATNADHLSPHLIELNITVIPQKQGNWTNHTLPSYVPSRASGELAWVPVSTNGILVALGGVTELVYETNTTSINSTDADTIAADSQAFMQFVYVYDIAANFWYQQRTSGAAPNALAQGCTVVASAEDGSSHNIYWYGGFDGTHPAGTFSDEVWVLSIPSFTWVLLSTGVASHARAGHRCVKPYPDQMFVIGGYTPEVGNSYSCVEGGIIQVFNLSSGQWLDSYDPNVFSQYQVPDQVVAQIGGSGSGRANHTAPTTGFATAAMTPLLASAYNTAKITTWYPYKEAVQTSSVPSPTSTNKSSGTPKYLAPVLAVILGLFFITLVVLGVLLWRRRKLLSTNRASQSDAGTVDTRFRRVSNWILGTPTDLKAPTVTTEEPVPITSGYKYDLLQEAGGVQVHEMGDTSVPAELRGTGPRGNTLRETILSDTGLIPIGEESPHELASQAERSGQRPISTGTLPRADSPTDARVDVGSPSVSPDPEHGHARGLSDVSVSADGDHVELVGGGITTPPVGGPTPPSQGQRPGAVSPMTPLEVVSSADGDYLTKGAEPAPESQTPANTRTSNFSEDLDEHRVTK